jgi:hypothetical protein
VQDERQVEWQLAAVRGGTAAQQLHLRADKYALHLPLPVSVLADAATAKFTAARQKLTVSWPLI